MPHQPITFMEFRIPNLPTPTFKMLKQVKALWESDVVIDIVFMETSMLLFVLGSVSVSILFVICHICLSCLLVILYQ